MKEAFERAGQRAAAAWDRSRDFVVTHPWLTLSALPALVLAYLLVMLMFTPGIGDIRKSKQEQPSVVLSADGKELAVFKRANRDWVKLSEISPHVVTALLATEDHRFHDHHGIDFKRTARAAFNTLRGDREGGSTLTQQLARNLYPEEIGRAPTITRKVKEAITALKIEAVYSKEEILETYLNSVSFLYNAWGIEMAARTYFDKPAKRLDELEAATLVGMLKGTSYYNPVLAPGRAKDRRNTVLAMMARHGKLPEARYQLLKAQPLKLDFERLPEFNGPAPHLAEFLRRWLLAWAEKNDYNIYADGLVVKTTIDSRLQTAANEALKRQAEGLQAVADVEWARSGGASFGTDPKAYVAQRAKVQPFEYFWTTHKDLLNAWIKESGEYRALREGGTADAEALAQLRANDVFMQALKKSKTRLQAGFLAIEPSTGHVRAWVGSRDYNDDKFDHVQQARRQPGSTFKPFVYGAAFEGGMSPAEQFMDSPVEILIDRNKVWRPSDVGEGPTNQPMTARDGLVHSRNSITAQLVQRVGPARVAELAYALGVRESKLDAVPSLALGTSPVTLKEMVTAYGTIANSGMYVEPFLVARVEDRKQKVLEEFQPKASQPGLATEAAQTLLDVMRGVIDKGTGVGIRARFGIQGDLAGKTGTTQDNTDGWFILMHPQLVAGAWVGFNDNRVSMRSDYWGQGAHNALLVVGDFFQQSFKARLLDTKSVFAAPRLKEQERVQEVPLLQRMGDWFGAVFGAPGAPDPNVAASPPVRLDPPVLEPPPWVPPIAGTPREAPLISPAPVAPQPPPPDAPVIIDNRVPVFPRQPEGPRPNEVVRTPEQMRPLDSVPGTQVYRSPEAPRTITVPRGAGTSGGDVMLVPRPLRDLAQSPAVIEPSPSQATGSANTPGSAVQQ